MRVTIPESTQKTLANLCGMARIDTAQVFQDAIREMAAGYGPQELALHLYERYGLRGNFETWHAHVRKCLSKDTRERFDFCDVFFMMHYTKNYQPLIAMCELLGFNPPAQADRSYTLQIKKVEHQRLLERAARLDSEIQQLSGVTEYRLPELTVSRFRAEKKSD